MIYNSLDGRGLTTEGGSSFLYPCDQVPGQRLGVTQLGIGAHGNERVSIRGRSHRVEFKHSDICLSDFLC